VGETHRRAQDTVFYDPDLRHADQLPVRFEMKRPWETEFLPTEFKSAVVEPHKTNSR
jgi:hypothetical protein